MFSKFFIERPVFAAVVALIICLAGLVSMSQLPVAQYPSITPVQVTVTATYPGADSQTERSRFPTAAIRAPAGERMRSSQPLRMEVWSVSNPPFESSSIPPSHRMQLGLEQA